MNRQHTGNLIFVYGSNMNIEQINARCRRPRVIGVAFLPDHTLAFFGHSPLWDGGEETAIFSPGDALYGVVYQLSAQDEDLLDASQGVRLNGTGAYFHFPVEVIGTDGIRHQALMYKKSVLGAPTLPREEALDYIIAGARAHALPDAYIDGLRQRPRKTSTQAIPSPGVSGGFAVVSAGCRC